MSEPFESPPLVKTTRLEFCLLQESHLNDFHLIWSNHSVTKWTTRGISPSHEESKTRISGIFFDPENPVKLNYGVVLKAPNSEETANGIMIGVIGVTSIPSPDTVEIGYIFNQSFWGQGYASEALSAYMEAYWEYAKNIGSMIAKVDPSNAGSIRVLEKCGFRFVEHLVGDIVLPEMGRRNTIVMKVDRP